ncbi:MAG: hypothetical protein HY918_03055 [Candidatus Doudnabacteria bacterium]|nr:hypothetical protein [Candidatus Doudnabacteria bacterium]
MVESIKAPNGAEGHLVAPNHFVESMAPPERGRWSAGQIFVAGLMAVLFLGTLVLMYIKRG